MSSGIVTEVKTYDSYYIVSFEEDRNFCVPREPGYLLMATGWEPVSGVRRGDAMWDLDTQGDIPEFAYKE